MTTVLIVDDNPQDAYLLRCVLAADGFEVLEARNGREALERSAEHPVDLVISDILMPVMDGFSLCRQWKANPEKRSTPFVFYTATYVDPKDEDLALKLGADLFLIKPADPAVLRERVAEVIRKHRQGQLARPVEPAAEVPYLQQYNAVLIHKLEDKLKLLEKTNQALRLKDLALACSASGILLTTSEGQVSYANPSMARLCEKPESEILGRPLAALFAEPEKAARWISEDLAKGPLELQLAPAPSRASPIIWVQATGHPVADDQGRRLGLMVSCRDISEEKRLRQELARIQRLEALGLFAAGVAHDFNNLLMAIYGALDLATEGADASVDREMALAAFERARDLTRRLLSFSKGSPSKRKPLDALALLDESISLALSGSAIRCERRYGPSLPNCLGDPGQLAQIFSNLLVNARQALKDRGTVVVSADAIFSQVPGPLSPGRYLRIRVQDDGPGIAPEVLPRVFEPFYTTKSEGTGLGLATSQAIAQEHGGSLSVATEVGAGTTFELLIPAAPEASGAERRAGANLARAGTGRILVMDDQVAIQALVQRGLERAGYSVVVASNGEQALLEIERERERGRSFDLLILDVTVRGGMGGVEALSKVRQLDPRVPAIAMTGYSEDSLKGSSGGQGFIHVLPKPFLVHELLGTIKAVLSPA